MTERVDSAFRMQTKERRSDDDVDLARENDE